MTAVQIDKTIIERLLLAIDDALIEGSFANSDVRDALSASSDELESALKQETL